MKVALPNTVSTVPVTVSTCVVSPLPRKKAAMLDGDSGLQHADPSTRQQTDMRTRCEEPVTMSASTASGACGSLLVGGTCKMNIRLLKISNLHETIV